MQSCHVPTVSTFITVNYHTPSRVSQLNSHFFCKSEHKTCLTNYNTGLQETQKHKEAWYKEEKRKQNNFYSESSKTSQVLLELLHVCVHCQPFILMQETQVSAVPSSGKILSSGNRNQPYLNILVLFPKRKMPVGWLRTLGIILDIGFCMGRVKFFLLSLFYHTKALKESPLLGSLTITFLNMY